MTNKPEEINQETDARLNRRLHPLSWLFVLMLHLKQFAFPLLALLITGRGDRNELWSLIGVALLALYSIFQYFTYQYRVLDSELIVRSGVFQKTVRHIPFNRIQNVSITQNVLHRFFQVAEVKLEAAGGVKPEAHMRVLSLADAQELEELIRSHANTTGVVTADEVLPAKVEVLHRLSFSDVVKLGLINNHGMVVIGAAVGLLFQTSGRMAGNFISESIKTLFGWSDSLHLGTFATVLSAVFAIILFLLLVRAFSVVLALLQYYGFSLSLMGRRLTVQRGLLSRLRSSLPLRRIQAYTIKEDWLHRIFRQRSLQVDSAAGAALNEEGKSPLRDLVPLARPHEMDGLVARFLASDQWPVQTWKSLHAEAWKREFLMSSLFLLFAGIAGAAFFNSYVALVLLLIPVLFLRAKVWAAHAAYAYTGDLIAVRHGWLSREWRFAEISKLQGLSLREGVFDRRYGMASLTLDTAGARAMSSPFRIPYMPRSDAQALLAELSKKIRQGPLPF